jgi:hypothetical protein
MTLKEALKIFTARFDYIMLAKLEDVGGGKKKILPKVLGKSAWNMPTPPTPAEIEEAMGVIIIEYPLGGACILIDGEPDENTIKVWSPYEIPPIFLPPIDDILTVNFFFDPDQVPIEPVDPLIVWSMDVNGLQTDIDAQFLPMEK